MDRARARIALAYFICANDMRAAYDPIAPNGHSEYRRQHAKSKKNATSALLSRHRGEPADHMRVTHELPSLAKASGHVSANTHPF